MVFRDETIYKILGTSHYQTTFELEIIYLNSLSSKVIGEKVQLTQEDIAKFGAKKVNCPENHL